MSDKPQNRGKHIHTTFKSALLVLRGFAFDLRSLTERFVAHPDGFTEAGNRFTLAAGLTVMASSLLLSVFIGRDLVPFFLLEFTLGFFMVLKPAMLRIRPNETPFAIVGFNFLAFLAFWILVGPNATFGLFILAMTGTTIIFTRRDRPTYLAGLAAAAISAYVLSFFWKPTPLMALPIERQAFARDVIDGFIVGCMFLFFILASVAFDATDTKLRKAREKLTIERDRARSSARARGDFLAMISHEFRTPLTTIVSATQVLRKRAQTRPIDGELRAIELSSLALLRFFDNALDFARYSSGRFIPDQKIVDIRSLTKEVIDILSPQIKSKNLDVTTEFGEACPHRITSDPALLRQLLTNLVGNAIKYTNEGAVRIRTTDYHKDGVLFIRIEVSDTGPGISDEYQRSIFEFFDRGGRPHSLGPDGVGLGLAVCKQIVQALDGRIGVASVVGDGSTFWFEVPFVVAPSPVAALSQGVPLPPLSVLLVEDHPFNRVIMKEQIEQDSHRVIAVDSCERALAAFAINPVDIILTDLYLGKRQGVEFARRIRSMNIFIPIIAITASMTDADIARCRNAGIDEVLVKPLSITAFREAASRLIAARRIADQTVEAHPALL